MTLRTRLTERLGLEHPALSAPMGFVAGMRQGPAGGGGMHHLDGRRCGRAAALWS